MLVIAGCDQRPEGGAGLPLAGGAAGSAFGAEGYVRLSFASSREDLQGGVEQLRKLLT